MSGDNAIVIGMAVAGLPKANRAKIIFWGVAGATLLRIETGLYQAEALRFYENAGFRRCGAFGPYADMPPHAIETSLFYEKAV